MFKVGDLVRLRAVRRRAAPKRVAVVLSIRETSRAEFAVAEVCWNNGIRNSLYCHNLKKAER